MKRISMPIDEYNADIEKAKTDSYNIKALEKAVEQRNLLIYSEWPKKSGDEMILRDNTEIKNILEGK